MDHEAVAVAEARFEPPFCPHPGCRWHAARSTRGWRWQRRGYRRVARSPGRIRRFVCLDCGRWFSSSTFREDYWSKRPGLSATVFHMLNGGKALRQVARTLAVSLATVRRRQRWLAQQSLLLHIEQLMWLAGRLDEPLALDGLRTFAGSQFEPLDLQTTILVESGFLLDIEAAPLRRSGTMTRQQRRERARRDRRLGRPDPAARRRATGAMLGRVLPLMRPGRPVVLRTDEEPAYGQAVRRSRHGSSVVHLTTSSRQRRDHRNPLWRINHLHRLMRHSLSNQKRETLAFSKRLAGLLDRALTYMVWHNNTKGLSERSSRTARQTPAMQLGLASRPLRGDELFRRRRFPGRCRLTDEMRQLYDALRVARPNERPALHHARFVA